VPKILPPTWQSIVEFGQPFADTGLASFGVFLLSGHARRVRLAACIKNSEGRRENQRKPGDFYILGKLTWRRVCERARKIQLPSVVQVVG